VLKAWRVRLRGWGLTSQAGRIRRRPRSRSGSKGGLEMNFINGFINALNSEIVGALFCGFVFGIGLLSILVGLYHIYKYMVG
jgi:hypothetical protein